MREHMGLYCGKRVDNGEWVEGFYLEFSDPLTGKHESYIQTVKSDGRLDLIHNVDPATVGECTSMCDKNGKLIFEGNILKGMRGLHRVYYDTSLACFEWARINGNWEESFSGFADEYEIIGNIYDNPELLESEG